MTLLRLILELTVGSLRSRLLPEKVGQLLYVKINDPAFKEMREFTRAKRHARQLKHVETAKAKKVSDNVDDVHLSLQRTRAIEALSSDDEDSDYDPNDLHEDESAQFELDRILDDDNAATDDDISVISDDNEFNDQPNDTHVPVNVREAPTNEKTDYARNRPQRKTIPYSKYLEDGNFVLTFYE